MSKQFNYGGQAVIEGVMMRGSRSMAIAVRDPDGEIIIHEQAIDSPLYSGVWSRIPFVRGLGLLWDSLGLGTQALNYSAKIASKAVSGNDETANQDIKAAATVGEAASYVDGVVPAAAGNAGGANGEGEIEFGGAVLWGTMIFSFAFAVGLFFLAPAAAADGLEKLLGFEKPLVGNLIEGLIRLILVVVYIWLIGRWSEIKRVFSYHGAEHKTINAYEADAPLTPESVAKYPREHPRCGTGFLLVVVVISVIVFSLLGDLTIWMRLLTRVVLIPVIAAIAYEYLRATAKHLNNPIIKVLIWPQLALQKLTTREPTLDMLEVGIAALQRVLEAEQIIEAAEITAEPAPAEAK
jgi:uncharacterized protein YqhQ